MIKKEENIRLAAKKLDKLAKWMDDYCLDAVIGFLPIGGDFTTYFLSLGYTYKVLDEHDLKEEYLFEMLKNLTIDLAVGFVPVLGDFADFFHKAKRKNANILKERLQQMTATF